MQSLAQLNHERFVNEIIVNRPKCLVNPAASKMSVLSPSKTPKPSCKTCRHVQHAAVSLSPKEGGFISLCGNNKFDHVFVAGLSGFLLQKVWAAASSCSKYFLSDSGSGTWPSCTLW